MNGFADHGLDAGDFGENKGTSLRSFDAFPKTKPTYLTRTQTGGPWTIILLCTSFWLIITETARWWSGTTMHSFSVEKGVSHQMQLNIDIVVAMPCDDVHVNIQDASGDRILASDVLTKHGTSWTQWSERRRRDKSMHQLQENIAGDRGESFGSGSEEDVHDYLGLARGHHKFPKTPRLGRYPEDACRVFGNMLGNKVQGDFHLTARGHGYMEYGEHLSHEKFNFSHQVNELSFGPYYPSLVNPLDNTYTISPAHFYKHQYYLSVVPTIYTADISQIREWPNPLDPSMPLIFSPTSIYTNQYAVTEQSHEISEFSVPGIFFKYDIEPIVLMVSEDRGKFLRLIVRLVNIVSGVLVAGGWLAQFSDWAVDMYGRRKNGGGGWDDMGMLHGRSSFDEKHYKV